MKTYRAILGGGSGLWAMAIRVICHFEADMIYGLKVWQFWCNVIWKFAEDLFTYQKVPFENFCDLWFSRKSRNREIFFAGPLHVSCMGWEVKIDMSGPSNDCPRVCNVKMKIFLPWQKWGTFPRMYGLWGCSVDRFEFFSWDLRYPSV